MQIGHAQLLKTNSATSFQDLGRTGLKHVGITQSGAADKHAAAWANRLLGNCANSTVLETFFGALKLSFDAPTKLCITGARNRAFLNGLSVPLWQTITVNRHDTVETRFPTQGTYNYISVLGGFIVEPILGSRSMCLREQIGPNSGEALSQGSLLRYPTYEPRKTRPLLTRVTPSRFIPNYESELCLPLMPGYQFQCFSKPQRHHFFNTDFCVKTDSNKMGLRLQNAINPALLSTSQTITSEGNVLGSVQIPPSGEPIVLLSEHPTIGGYPKIGVVGQTACFQLAQRRPGQSVRFYCSTIEKQQQKLRDFYSFFNMS